MAGFRSAAQAAVTAFGATVAVSGALLLGGCGGAQAPADPPRPVLVVHPAAAGGLGAEAFAGDVHARQESPLAFRVGGNLVRRLVDVGARVHRGQVLAELDPGDLRLQVQASQAQLAAAEAELSRTAADRARYAALAKQQLVSRSALDAQDAAYKAAAGQVRALRAQRDVAGNAAGYSRLTAPRDGVIASREAEAGQVVAAGQPVFTLAGDGAREVAIAIPESEIHQVHVGQPALVELWSADGKRIPGVIREIAPAADPQARTYAARVTLQGDADQVVLGQSARVYLQGGDAQAPLVPLSAVQPAARGGSALWVVDAATHRLRLVPVRLGAYGSDGVPVLAGVSPRDWIVAAGGHLLHEGERVAPMDRDNRAVAATASTARQTAER
jgi:multidrug efflux system membrane fusion protein